MLRRVRWFGFGAAAGAGGIVWAQREVKKRTQKYLPPAVRERVREQGVAFGDRVKETATYAKEVQRDAENRYREKFGLPQSVGTNPRPDAGNPAGKRS